MRRNYVMMLFTVAAIGCTPAASSAPEAPTKPAEPAVSAVSATSKVVFHVPGMT